MTDAKIQKALEIQKVVAEYFEKSNNSKIMAKDLMNLFISKGIFSKDYRKGLPIRILLRSLSTANLLHLIPQVHFEQKTKNKYWYFINTNSNSI